LISVVCSCFFFGYIMPYGTKQLYLLIALVLLIIIKHRKNIYGLVHECKSIFQKG
jgi:glycerol-3-phosphate acyltransferase PlsY